MITEYAPGACTPGTQLVSEQNPAVIRLRELKDIIKGQGISMLNCALEQGEILTRERAKHPARAKKGEYGWTDFLIDANIAPVVAFRRMELWTLREEIQKLNSQGEDKPTLTLADAERIIGARPKVEKPTLKPVPKGSVSARIRKFIKEDSATDKAHLAKCIIAEATEHIRNPEIIDVEAINAPKTIEVEAKVVKDTHEEDPLPVINATAPETAVIAAVVRKHDKNSILVIKQERFENLIRGIVKPLIQNLCYQAGYKHAPTMRGALLNVLGQIMREIQQEAA